MPTFESYYDRIESAAILVGKYEVIAFESYYDRIESAPDERGIISYISLNRTMIGLKEVLAVALYVIVAVFESYYDRIERGIIRAGQPLHHQFESYYDRIERQ